MLTWLELMLRACCAALLILLVASCGGDDDPVDAAVDADMPDGSPGDGGGGDAAADADVPDADGGRPGPPELNIPACEPSGAGDVYTYVIDVMDLAQVNPADPTIVAGFDIDDRISDTSDPEGCFKADFRSGPPDDREGVDAQLNFGIFELGLVDDVTDSYADSIAAGLILVLLEVSDVDDLVNDDCVHVGLLRAQLQPTETEPALDRSGRFRPRQTFDVLSEYVDADGAPVQRFADGRIEGGRLVTRATTPIDILAPVTRTGEPGVAAAHFAELTADITRDELAVGYLGGGLVVEDLIERNAEFIEDPEVIRLTLNAYTDLWPTGGACAGLSTTLAFAAVSAQRGEVVAP